MSQSCWCGSGGFDGRVVIGGIAGDAGDTKDGSSGSGGGGVLNGAGPGCGYLVGRGVGGVEFVITLY